MKTLLPLILVLLIAFTGVAQSAPRRTFEGKMITFTRNYRALDSVPATLYNGVIKGNDGGCFYKCLETDKCILSVFDFITKICKLYTLVPNFDLKRIENPKSQPETVLSAKYNTDTFYKGGVQNFYGMKFTYNITDKLIQIRKV